jgi:outer membrane lipoprotein-sorting protein
MYTRRIFSVIAFVCLTFAAAPAQELTLDEILKKNEDALGGAEAVNKIQSLKMTLKMVVGGGQMELPMTIWTKRPNFVRSETAIQGKSIVTAYDGTTAWMINPLTGSSDPQKMDEKMATNLASSDMDSSIGSLAAFKAGGHTVELLAKEDVEGSPAYKIKVTRKGGLIITYLVDAGTFLPIKFIAKVSQMGQEMEIESYPSNYKKVGGVMFAFALDGKVGGRSMMQMSYEKIEINEPMDDSLFKMPAAEKPVEKK